MSNTKKKWLPGDRKPDKIIDEMIRVDHSGEYGAKKIYTGQIAATKLKNIMCSKDIQTIEILQEMYDQECKHYDYFANAIRVHKIRPSCFLPLWSLGGFLMGYISALLGKETAMACTVAVETVIGKHYGKQLEILATFSENDLEKYDTSFMKDLYEKISIFKEEEMEHLQIGLDNKAEKMHCYSYFSMIIRLITCFAIVVAKRF